MSALCYFLFWYAVDEVKLSNVSEREQRGLSEGDTPTKGMWPM